MKLQHIYSLAKPALKNSSLLTREQLNEITMKHYITEGRAKLIAAALNRIIKECNLIRSYNNSAKYYALLGRKQALLNAIANSNYAHDYWYYASFGLPELARKMVQY